MSELSECVADILEEYFPNGEPPTVVADAIAGGMCVLIERDEPLIYFLDLPTVGLDSDV